MTKWSKSFGRTSLYANLFVWITFAHKHFNDMWLIGLIAFEIKLALNLNVKLSQTVLLKLLQESKCAPFSKKRRTNFSHKFLSRMSSLNRPALKQVSRSTWRELNTRLFGFAPHSNKYWTQSISTGSGDLVILTR